MARRKVVAGILEDWSILMARASFLVTPSSIQLPLGDDAGAVEGTVGLLHFHGEIDAGAAVKLRDDHPLGAVDDELPPADHDGNLADVDRLLQHVLGVLAGQPAADAERHAEGQAQVAALLHGVAGLGQLVGQIVQGGLFVVADDGEDLPEQGFQAFALAPGRIGFQLQEPRVAGGLNLDEIRHRGGVAHLGKVPDLIGSQHDHVLVSKVGPTRVADVWRTKPKNSPRTNNRRGTGQGPVCRSIDPTRDHHRQARPRPVPGETWELAWTGSRP